ncbi:MULTISPECIES: peptidoglycan D,D-transpeptidase FtsI family protein [Streptosporangium]|uniref:Peptidoglycan glycosyltransferase n=1 Tax=Streptosporangium brasiliense TaxID=47480 RepID=A0ABT9R9U4_9ACTN|nr:penicillin-binding protein 2 [Streptosporangium brasiliense]MDP9865626.1 peptidoglycan glycosyltransferase [Streptosporangium brasiliense]
MAAPRARRINIPLRRVALMCGAMLFALLAQATHIQAFEADRLNEDPRNPQRRIARFETPRGEILLRDGTVVATSRESGDGTYRYRRSYPWGPLYAPVTGHLSLYGGTGIEAAENAVLSGGDPWVKLRSLVDGTEGGATLELTIDGRAQRAAYEALRATGLRGAAVAIDPATGAILAMVSFPSYDPNLYTTFDSAELDRVDRRLRSDPGDPLLNRAIQRNYPPGSAFKVVTSAAALISGRYSPTVRVEAPTAFRLPGTGTYLRNSGGTACGDGDPPLAYAFKTSCNTPFAKMGIDLGQDALREQAEAFGFGADDLTVPMPVAESVYPRGMDQAQTAMSALGQFDDRATPLMIAMISAAVANDGVLMRPYLVEQVRLADGAVIDEADPSPYRRTLDEDEADRLTAMMVTVTQPGGTGTAAAVPGVDVAAKTGTAENAASGQDHAVFTGFAPAATPRVAVGVLVEHGGSGGRTAAPVAAAVMRAVLGIRPE